MQALSARLEAIVQSLRPCRLLADVGTDHARLPIVAVLRGVAVNAIASDLREAPLRLAQRNIELAGLGSRVTTARADGLSALAGRGVDAVVMAGMGGELIARLCGATPEALPSVEQLVLQPNSFAHAVRAWARSAGWHLRDERMVETGGRFFVVCAYAKGAGPDPAYAIEGWTAAALDLVGPLLLARKDPALRRSSLAQRDRLRDLLRDGAPTPVPELDVWEAACAYLG